MKYAGISFGTLVLVVAGFFFIGVPAPASPISWGVTFSPQYAESLGLDPEAAYRAMLDDLQVKDLRLAAPWDILNPAEGTFDFSALDRELQEAKSRGASALLVVGMKTPRWPECHIPDWAKTLDKKSQQAKLLEYLAAVVTHYKSHPEIWAWQIENEPFFSFGDCPWRDDGFLKQEIATVKKIDPVRPIVVSESGEWSPWFTAASLADIVGTTLYRGAYFDLIQHYITYPFPPVFYARKAALVKWLFGKNIIDVELQAEPWSHTFISGLTNEEMDQTMSIDQFKKNIEFAKHTGIGKHYLWGAEWWYFMKEKRNNPAYWNEAKQIFAKSY